MNYPSFLPTVTGELSEETSINLLRQIQQISIDTPFAERSILTTHVRAGEGGTPFLLLHGFDSSLLEYRRLLPLLAEKRETLAVDLLGFGFTDRSPDVPVSPETIKTHLYYFWKTSIAKPIILVGASMGGAVALDFTLTYPEAVEKIVLIDSAGLANPPILGKYLFPPLDRLATDFLANPRVRENISRTAYFDKTLASTDACTCAALHLNCPNWSQALISFTKSGGYGGFLPKLSNIQQETLIIWGENDRILGTKDAYRFQKALPNNRLLWIPECGHVPHLEKPGLTVRSILDFAAKSL
ncbi:alpha/beta hydrolase [Pannus brasiliensis CCIBt3594]|uniref:Alpha/beta hydrolase n=1 Tax=Pannus brasiliensis CCIBt3594 TaxID=1427578 RepID=A0AAW9QWB7_9CHRO